MLLKIRTENNSELFEITVQKKEKLSEAIWLSGKFAPRSLCGSYSLCGRCAVRFLTNPPDVSAKETKYFTREELKRGWRLACQHIVDDSSRILDLQIREPLQPSKNTATPFEKCGCVKPCNAYAGIDLGTTTIAWRLVLPDQKMFDGELPNPQNCVGPDIVSRLSYASSNDNNDLTVILIDALRDFVKKARSSNVIVQRMCIAANSALTHMLFSKDLDGLCAAPYKLAWKGSEITRLPGIDCKVVVPPLPAPFVGGDISAGLLSLFLDNAIQPFILVDLGTNGELALINRDILYVASVPMGPAMEGIGPSMGAMPGADIATRFRLAASGIVPYDMHDDTLEKVNGISATGYLSLLSLLLKMGLLEISGNFVTGSKKFSRTFLNSFIRYQVRDGIFETENGVILTNHDVELLLMVKGAFSTALQMLLEAAGLSSKSLEKIYLAGALGQYASAEDLCRLGFFPPGLQEKLAAADNTSLKGATLLAANPDYLSLISGICQNARVLDLANNPGFQSRYMQSLKFQWMDE